MVYKKHKTKNAWINWKWQLEERFVLEKRRTKNIVVVVVFARGGLIIWTKYFQSFVTFCGPSWTLTIFLVTNKKKNLRTLNFQLNKYEKSQNRTHTYWSFFICIILVKFWASSSEMIRNRRQKTDSKFYSSELRDCAISCSEQSSYLSFNKPFKSFEWQKKCEQ